MRAAVKDTDMFFSSTGSASAVMTNYARSILSIISKKRSKFDLCFRFFLSV